ncbi:MAG: hypothetical protein ACN6OJ_01000 [Chryseobacterium sp.]|uniref:hypothetical protein n=1 Tax=Chryseobacterium sp. TaxID=1871047 RepID=UPI003D14D1B7
MKKLLIILAVMSIFGCSPKTEKDMSVKDFKFNTEYNQFYITSDKASFVEDSIKADKAAYIARLGVEKNALVIFTQSYSNVKGKIEVLENGPVQNIDFTKYDHIVEGGIKSASGNLEILSWPGSDVELSIKVKPGDYRVRIYSSNFASVEETDLANDTDNDYYRIEIWPSHDMERKVLKQYNNPL